MKKVLAFVLSAFMLFALVPANVFAASEVQPDAKGTMNIVMNKDGDTTPSMCDPLFGGVADVEIFGEDAVIKIYVAFPVPTFPDQGKDGTLKDFVITYKDKQYTAVSDIESKPMMTAKATNPLFGLTEGTEVQAQVLTVKLPKAALEEKYLDVNAFVNVFMMSPVDFDLAMSNLKLEETKPQKLDAKGTMKVVMNKDGETNPSMCDALFGGVADVEIYGENAVIKIYVAFPVPGFPDQGKDGTLKDFVVTYKDKQYTAVSDIESKPMMTAKATNPLFGLTEGTEVPAQVVTVKLPKAALEEKYLDVNAFVNVVMMCPVDFDLAMSDLKVEEIKPEVPEVNAEDKETGIKVHADKGVFQEVVSLVVKQFAAEEESYKNAAEILNDISKKFQLLDIRFENQDGVEVQPNGEITVSYKIPEGYNASEVALYRINEDGTRTKVEGMVENGYYKATQNLLGTYALVEIADANPPTGDRAPVFAMIALAAASAAAVVIVVAGKKRNAVN